MCPITVVIPSVGCSNLAPGLITGLLSDPNVSDIRVYENRERGRAYEQLKLHNLFLDERVHYARIVGSIYDAWNWGMDRAEDRGGICVILNDDVILPWGACTAIRDLMIVHPDYGIMGFAHEPLMTDVAFGITEPIHVRQVYGTYRTHGIGGFAFAVWPDFVARVDDQFQWWYGDDDLVQATLAMGLKVGVAEGIPVSHPHAETSAVFFPELNAVKGQDHERYVAKWGP